MPLGNRSARRRGMIAGAMISSSRNAKRQAVAAQQAATPAQAPAPAANQDTVEQLKQFAELRDQGILTDAEFEAKKKQLLGL